MSILKKLMGQAKKAEIGYGVHENCVILSVSNDQRKTNDGVKIKRNNFTMFGKFNKDGDAIIAQKEVSWFNLDPTKKEYVYGNFISQLDQLVGILDCYYTDDKLTGVVAETIDSLFAEEEIENQKDLEEALLDKSTCKSLFDGITEAYETLVEPHIGEDKTPIRVKFTYDPKGQYLQNPRYNPFTESMEVDLEDTKLLLTEKENEYYQKSLSTNTAPVVKPSASSNTIDI